MLARRTGEANLSGGASTSQSLSLPRPSSWWTGTSPERTPGFCADGKLRSLPLPCLDGVNSLVTQRYFDNTWTLTETLFSGLQGEEPFFRPPYHELRHPLIFYYGHPACLYINKLLVSGVLSQGVDPYFERIFETGVDEMRWDDLSKNYMEWPSVDIVRQYRAEVYAVVSSIIEHELPSPPEVDTEAASARVGGLRVDSEHPLWALFMSFEHERIHLETSSVLIRELPVELLAPPPEWPAPATSSGRVAAGQQSGGGEGEGADAPLGTRSPLEGADFPPNSMLPVAVDTVVLGTPACQTMSLRQKQHIGLYFLREK